MSRRLTVTLALAVGVLSIAATGCGLLGGASTTIADQEELIAIVQRVSLVPGVDALDPSGPTAVGTDWRKVVFTFTEPIAQSAIDAFDPACNLLHPGLDLDPAQPPAFNALGVGLIPPRTRLTVTFKPMAEGEYTLTLVSGGACPALKADASQPFLGTFKFHVSVIASDGKDPYIVSFRPNLSGIADEIDPLVYFATAGKIPMGSAVPPHAKIEVTFSQEIRTPAPVEIKPTIPGFPVGGVPGDVPDGVSFTDSVRGISYSDSVEGTVAFRAATILSSQTPEGMDLDTDYTFAFRGLPPMTSVQSFIRDRSGLPLTVRFQGGPRDLAALDTRTLHTAPVRIETPFVGSYLNAAAFAGISGVASLTVAGTMADRVDGVDLSLRATDGSFSADFGAATRTVMPAQNQLGTPIDDFSGSVGLPASIPDGEYIFAATAKIGAQDAGADEITITKDTISPTVLAGGEVEMLATDADVPSFCADASPDTVRASLTIAGHLLETVTTWTDHLVASPFGVAHRFCFSSASVMELPGLHAGVNVLALTLEDAAGNSQVVERTLSIHGVIGSIAPQDAQPGDIVTISGFGLQPLSQSDDAVFDGSSISLSHHLLADDSDTETIFAAVMPFGTSLAALTTVQIRLPHFAASGPFAFTIQGIATTSKALEICTPLVPPFASEHAAIIDPGAPAGFLGDLTETGLSREVFRNGESVFLPAGAPIAAARRVASVSGSHGGDLKSTEWNGARWIDGTIASLPADAEFAGTIALARSPVGDAVAAYEYRTPDGVFVALSRRVPATSPPICAPFTPCPPNLPEWTRPSASLVATFPPTDAALSGAIAVSFTADGRAGIVYSAPAVTGGPPVLYASIERTAGTGTYDPPVAIDGAPGTGASVSTAFDSSGVLWAAWTRMIPGVPMSEITDTSLLDVHVARVGVNGAVDHFGSPGPGVWPSIAVMPDGAVGVAAQHASITNLRQTIPFGRGCSLLFSIDVGSPDFATLEGSTWHHETIDARGTALASLVTALPSASCDTDPVITGNPAATIPRSILRVAPDGVAKFAYVRQEGELVFARRDASGSWTSGLAVIGQRLFGDFGLSLDGVGRARVLYQDAALGQLRIWAEDDDRAVDPAVDRRGCHQAAFSRQLASPDLTGFVEAHRHFPFSVAWLENLPDYSDPSPLTEAAHQADLRNIYVTALSGHGPIHVGATTIDSEARYSVESHILGSECPDPICPPGHTCSTCSTISFAITIDYPRGDPSGDLRYLAGSVAVVHDVDTDTDVAGFPTLHAAIRGNPDVLDFNPARVTQPHCSGVDGEVNPNDCGFDLTALAAEYGFDDHRLPSLLARLFALPPSSDLDTSEFRFTDLLVRLRGVSASTFPSAHSAGRLRIGVGIASLEASGVLSGSLQCNGSGHTDASGNVLGIAGFPTVIGQDAGATGLFDASSSQPELELHGLETSIGGSVGCDVEENAIHLTQALGLVGWLSRVTGASSGATDFSSVIANGGALNSLKPILFTPALTDLTSDSPSGAPWTARVRPDGTIELEVPR